MPSNKSQEASVQQELIQSDPMAAAKNNPCPICRANRVPPPCKGHAKEASDSTDNDDDVAELRDQGHVPKTLVRVLGTLTGTQSTQLSHIITLGMGSFERNQQPQLIFNPEVVSELLLKKLLLINHDHEAGILAIKLQCNPNVLSEEQRNALQRFVDTVLNEFEDFKKENAILSSNSVIIDTDSAGHFLSLRVSLLTPSLYDAWIQRLVSKHILTPQKIEPKNKAMHDGSGDRIQSSALSMKPKPSMNRGVTSKDEDEDQAARTSIRPRTPLDAPKPRGWE